MEEPSWYMTLLSNPFLRGLMIGLLVAVILWGRGLFRSRSLNLELKKLRDHLQTRFEIDSEENERRKTDREQLKQERDNLRNTLQVLNQKPGKQEIRQAQVYQRALEIMFEKSPGFAPAWQITLKDAEEEMRSAERGIIPFFKRMTSSTAHSPQGEEKSEKSKKYLELEDPAHG